MTTNFTLTPQNINQTPVVDQGHIHLYIDGVDVTGTVSNSTLLNSGRPFRIGVDTNGLGAIADYTNARLAMVGLHSRAITPAEVAYLSSVALRP